MCGGTIEALPDSNTRRSARRTRRLRRSAHTTQGRLRVLHSACFRCAPHGCVAVWPSSASLAIASPALAVKSNIAFSVSRLPSDFRWTASERRRRTRVPAATTPTTACAPSTGPHGRATGWNTCVAAPSFPTPPRRSPSSRATRFGSSTPRTAGRSPSPRSTASRRSRRACSASRRSPGSTPRGRRRSTSRCCGASRATSPGTTTRPGRAANRPTNAFEDISYGRLTAVGDTTFAGTFSTPINGGDYVTVSQTVDRIDGDVNTTESFSVTAPVGVVRRGMRCRRRWCGSCSGRSR